MLISESKLKENIWLELYSRVAIIKLELFM